jgi:hypothetical protein
MSEEETKKEDDKPATPTFEIPDEVESLEAVPEAIRDLYTEEGGVFKRRDLKKVLATMQHAKANEKEAKAEAAKLRKIVETVSDVDVEEYASLKAEHEKRQIDEAERKGEYDKIIAKHKSAHLEEMNKLKEDLSASRRSFHDHVIVTEITRLAAELKANATGLKWLPVILKDKIKVTEDDGATVTRILGEDGHPRLNSSGEYMTVKDLMIETKDTDGALFNSSGATGGGAVLPLSLRIRAR